VSFQECLLVGKQNRHVLRDSPSNCADPSYQSTCTSRPPRVRLRHEGLPPQQAHGGLPFAHIPPHCRFRPCHLRHLAAQSRPDPVRPVPLFSGGLSNGNEYVYFYDPFGHRMGVYQIRNPNWGSNVYCVCGKATSLWFAARYVGEVPDRVGSVIGYGLYPYGEDYTPTSNDADKFATYYRDNATGLDYAKSRYYSSILGRFLSADPSTANAMADPGPWNKYAYVGGDPVNFKDPPGLFQCNGDQNCYYWEDPPIVQNPPGLEPFLPPAQAPTPPNPGPPPVSGRSGGALSGSALETAALQSALTALLNPKCASIFNTDPNSPHSYDSGTVLQAMITGVALGTTYFGDVQVGRMILNAAAVTVPVNGVTTGAGARASSANIVLQSNPLSSGYYLSQTPQQLALTLLHELGHVFNIVTSLGGSKIVWDGNPDGSPNDAAEAKNAKTLENCKPK
jgi:RHS repeat-associated protein